MVSVFKQSLSRSGISKRAGRNNSFRIRLFTDDHGFRMYSLENSAEGRKIFVPHFIFGMFRAAARTVLEKEVSKETPEAFEHAVAFLNRDYFYLKSSLADLSNLIIQDVEEREGSSGYITVSRDALAGLDELLYNEKLQHPDNVLEEIIAYHKLFQFSFVKGSKSITSSLILRTDVLQHEERFTPSLAEKVELDRDLQTGDALPGAGPPSDATLQPDKSPGFHVSKLGERADERGIKVDYEEVFGDKTVVLENDSDEDESTQTASKRNMAQFPTPLSGDDVKRLEDGRYYFELSAAEATDFRDRFIKDRAADFYLGFEIVDALYTQRKKVRTFRFPLYYMKVNIREAGRRIYLEPRENGQFFLNHIALANLVDKYSDSAASAANIDAFFKTLLAQDISIDRINDRIRLARHLPIKESIFDRTREVLFGYADENGKGGILADLKVEGIECDLQSVYLYRAPKLLNPVDQALEMDLDRINDIAHHSMKRYYRSLLGRFLVPEQQTQSRQGEFAKMSWMPGMPPKSARNLMDRLNSHDIVLLEGPPGTGKTHSIMNLLIHCISSEQRVLVVSDQKAAIEALVEKLEDYLIGKDLGTPAETKWKDLFFSAVKVIDDLEKADQGLPELLDELSQSLSVRELPPGETGGDAGYERKLRGIKSQIGKLTDDISRKMSEVMGEDVAFERRIVRGDDVEAGRKKILEFLSVLQSENPVQRRLIDAFITNRFMLQAQMPSCYGFFKLPVKNISTEIYRLREDEKILGRLVEAKVGTADAFREATYNCPRHELIRHLEGVAEAQESTEGKALKRTLRRIRNRLRPPLLRDIRILLGLVRNQVELLEMSTQWSDDLWQLLRELHESIRRSDTPNFALSLYHCVQARDHRSSVNRESIQGDLREIEELNKQHDEIVKLRMVERLQNIVHDATASKMGSGTNQITKVMALIDSLKHSNSFSEGVGVFDELTQTLSKTFPVWIVRKQLVPFLLPCQEQSFDLVVIDEATQCRVDDSLPLMFRAKKILVVGDDRQTVLQKDSVIDDYLFKDHSLDEHLRSTQARGFKGGGSNIFELVKSIKQASVMLDEHFRCPPDIIEFSNKYVYDDKLKVMQWNLPENESSVVIDFSEQPIESSTKPTSGKFKGLETGMVDRFMEYVVRTVRSIERKTGKRINVESDVALCYFLLKNEPYVKSIKDEHLAKLNRGDDILDGAGAALQGKERDYIFYFWDVTRHNLAAFKQGDDADKRKGELNVLMSRPKKKAYHFLHRDFDKLDHSRSTITRYLWRSHCRAQESSKVKSIGSTESALQDSLFGSLLKFSLDHSSKRAIKDVRQHLSDREIDVRGGITVGDAGRVVDLVAFPAGKLEGVVGLVDLSGFGSNEGMGEAVVDYFFQLKRAAPRIDPVFLFPQELIDENGQTFGILMQKLEALDVAGPKEQLEPTDLNSGSTKQLSQLWTRQ